MANILPILDTNLVRDNNTVTNDNFDDLNLKKIESDIDMLPVPQQPSFVKINGIVKLSKSDYDAIISYDANILYIVETVGIYLGALLVAELNPTP